MGISFGEDQQH